MNKKLLLAMLMLLCFSSSCLSEDIVSFREEALHNDFRYNYEIQLVELALNKTTKTHGAYRIERTPHMTIARSIKSVEMNTYENFFFLASYQSAYDETMMFIPIPIVRGLVGYRVFLTTPQGQEKLNNIKTVEQLKRLRFIQGIGWQDVNILQYNNFNVSTISKFVGLFQILSQNRADLLPRGISEYEFEILHYQDIAPNLILDNKYLLYYDFPRFLYTNKSNTKMFERIKQGLEIAWQDGSFVELWRKYHQEAITKANLKDRTLIKLKNPELQHLNHDISKYLYRPD